MSLTFGLFLCRILPMAQIKLNFSKNPPFLSLQKLQQEKKELEEELQSVHKGNPTEEKNRSLDAEDVDESEERVSIAKHSALSELLLGRLRSIKISLKKVQHGSYGICDRCGKEIDKARLSALPGAHYCLACEKDLEKNEQY